MYFRRYNRFLSGLLLLADLVTIVASFLIAYRIRVGAEDASLVEGLPFTSLLADSIFCPYGKAL
ncbi:MAG: hypothetical protein HZB26_19455 [Candidatus Hydrogenedentes bacterium]|nr:hypothetical protein [Candidatus Hydrogenedentota bacterium]